jgi:hypothetical protein
MAFQWHTNGRYKDLLLPQIEFLKNLVILPKIRFRNGILMAFIR